MSEIGRRSAELGISVVYHNHMGSLSEPPEGLDRVLEATHLDHVRLLLDVAHYKQGGGDPAAAVTRYAKRLALLHLKDVRPAAPGSARPYQWVELGEGTVDLRAVFAALDGIAFHGWAIVELDEVPVPGRTELESALMSRRYLELKLSRRV
jgi:inosose dehydratase